MNLIDHEHTGRTFVIAEIAQAHDGSLGILQSLVDAVATTGVDAIKFQVHIADAESSLLEPFRVQFSPSTPTAITTGSGWSSPSMSGAPSRSDAML